MKQDGTEETESATESTSAQLNDVSPGEIVIGVLEGLDEQGHALVSYAENAASEPLVAISTVALNQMHAGRQVALLFAEGNPEKPVIMGLIHDPLYEMIESFEQVDHVSAEDGRNEDKRSEDKRGEDKVLDTSRVDDVRLDGKRVILQGEEEIVLKCGDASITLTKAGKVLIRGKYLSSRSSGVNRIMGGSVQVN
ncbi:Mll2356 protein [hydrothermal vent metagenome]|uniref:Mll2356 protein n=1 Tax=hydrothermal vent metagenome TaxID=652676 RepID=A0A3B0XVJ1_9ZZZZ